MILLIYNYDLGENGKYWEAGPATDFTEILNVYSTSSLAAAKKLMHRDPFYQEGILYDDWWFEWQVHVPTWKIDASHREMMEGLLRAVHLLPNYPPGAKPEVNEIKVETVTPPKLFVSISRAQAKAIKKIERDQRAGKPVPAFFIMPLTVSGRGVRYRWATTGKPVLPRTSLRPHDNVGGFTSNGTATQGK